MSFLKGAMQVLIDTSVQECLKIIIYISTAHQDLVILICCLEFMRDAKYQSVYVILLVPSYFNTFSVHFVSSCANGLTCCQNSLLFILAVSRKPILSLLMSGTLKKISGHQGNVFSNV